MIEGRRGKGAGGSWDSLSKEEPQGPYIHLAVLWGPKQDVSGPGSN